MVSGPQSCMRQQKAVADKKQTTNRQAKTHVRRLFDFPYHRPASGHQFDSLCHRNLITECTQRDSVAICFVTSVCATDALKAKRVTLSESSSKSHPASTSHVLPPWYVFKYTLGRCLQMSIASDVECWLENVESL